MAVYEFDDLGLRIIGYNQGVYFYDPERNLCCELYLKPDGTLASNCTITGSASTPAVTPGATPGITAVLEGPGIDIIAPVTTTPQIGLGLDLPLLSHGDGSPASEYATFAAALAAASAGDAIFLAPGEYAGNHTVGAGVTVVGLSRDDVVLTGQITVHGALINVTVDRDEDEVGAVVGVQLENGGVVSDCTLRVVNATGDVHAVYAEGDVTAYAYRLLFDLSAGGDAYGAYADGAEVYLEYSAFLPGTTYIPAGVA